MLTKLSPEQLDAIAPIGADGTITVDREALFTVLDEVLDVRLTGVAISLVDYAQTKDGVPVPETRAIRGIAWESLEDNRCRKWSFRSDGLALSSTDEGEHRCPVSEDADLVARAIIAIADSYPETLIDERNNRLTVLLPDGATKKARVVVIHDPRVVRAEDVLEGLEGIAYRAGTLGVAIVQPIEGGQAVVRKFGLD